MSTYAYVHGTDRNACRAEVTKIGAYCRKAGLALPKGHGFADFDRADRAWHRRLEGETLAKRLRRDDTVLITSPFAAFGSPSACLKAMDFLRNRGVELVITEEAIPGLDALLAADRAQQARAKQLRTQQTRQAIAERKNRGRKWNANAPLGFRWFHRTLRPWPEERAEMAQVVELRESGLSYRQAAVKMLYSTRQTVRGRDWTIDAVLDRCRAAIKLRHG